MENFTRAVHKELFPETSYTKFRKNFNEVIEALKKRGLFNPVGFAVAMGTIRAEVGSFEPISEYPSRYNRGKDGTPFAKYWENLKIRKSLGNTSLENALLMHGRGYVQLTGENNYKQAQYVLGINVFNTPSLANDPKNAAEILAWFIDKSGAVLAAANNQLKRSRRLVNGGSHGLETFRKTYKAAYKMACAESEVFGIGYEGEINPSLGKRIRNWIADHSL